MYVSRGLWCWVHSTHVWSSGRKCLQPTWTCWKTLLRWKPKTLKVVSARVPSNTTPSQQWSLEQLKLHQAPSTPWSAFTKRLANLHTKPRSCSSENAGASTNPHSGPLRDQTNSLDSDSCQIQEWIIIHSWSFLVEGENTRDTWIPDLIKVNESGEFRWASLWKLPIGSIHHSANLACA